MVTNKAGQGRVAVAGGRVTIFCRAGQGGQGSRCGGAGRQFFLKIIFIIEHIKKTRIFLKKKIEK